MITRRTRRYLLIGVVALVPVVAAYFFIKATIDTRERAENRVRKFLLAEATPKLRQYVSEYHISARRLGLHSWVVGYGSAIVTPSIPRYCLIDQNKNVYHMEAQPLSKVMRDEFAPNAHEPDHQEFIERFLMLLHHESNQILDEAHIQGLRNHQSAPLPEDFASKLQPPEKRPDGTYVFYAYQSIGGFLRRYEFRYDPAGGFLEAIVSELGNRLGPADYYE